jgi:hypothetical protein
MMLKLTCAISAIEVTETPPHQVAESVELFGGTRMETSGAWILFARVSRL